MSKSQYDICCGDFNPSLFFVSKIEKGHKTSPHSHDFPQLTYVASGKGHYHADGKVYPIHAGDLLLFPSNIIHFYVEEEADNCVLFNLGFANFQFCGLPENTIPFPSHTAVYHASGDFRHQLNNLFHGIFLEGTSNRSGRYYMQKTYLMQILLLIYRELTQSEKEMDGGCHFETNTKNYAVKQIITYLNEHFSEHISLDQIAQNMYLSSVYISKIFKEETGESPINYLISLRLEKAKEYLLADANASIKEIAHTVGYDDVYHFSKLFKKYYGLSPLNYRKHFSKH